MKFDKQNPENGHWGWGGVMSHDQVNRLRPWPSTTAVTGDVARAFARTLARVGRGSVLESSLDEDPRSGAPAPGLVGGVVGR